MAGPRTRSAGATPTRCPGRRRRGPAGGSASARRSAASSLALAHRVRRPGARGRLLAGHRVARTSAARGDDAAVIAAARNVLRGEIFDRDGDRLAWNERDQNGEPYRVYASNALSGVIGYSVAPVRGRRASRRAWNAAAERRRLGRPAARAHPQVPAPTRPIPQDLRTTLVLQLQQAAVDGARAEPRGRRDARPAQRRGPRARLDADVQRLRRRQPATVGRRRSTGSAPTTARRSCRARRPACTCPARCSRSSPRSRPSGSGAVVAEHDVRRPASDARRRGWLIDGFRVRDGHHADDRRSRARTSTRPSRPRATSGSPRPGVRTGGEALAEWAGRLGFGAPLPFDLDDRGLAGHEWRRRRSAAASRTGSSSRTRPTARPRSLVTPLQMALVAATVANDGELMRPAPRPRGDGQGRARRRSTRRRSSGSSAPGVASEIGAAMRLAVSGQIGRVFTAGANVPRPRVAGKSGTAELDAGTSPHSWFIGFAPDDDPQVAIAVLVERSGGGTSRRRRSRASSSGRGATGSTGDARARMRRATTAEPTAARSSGSGSARSRVVIAACSARSPSPR